MNKEFIELLEKLIATPSLSREEDEACNVLCDFLNKKQLRYWRNNNNVWIRSDKYNAGLPTILLNSHLDTVKPNDNWKTDPYKPVRKHGKLSGLGSNDAGGCLVSLLDVFLRLNEDKNRPYNLIYAATAEEEITGSNGISSIIDEFGKIDLAIVGEPTQMNMAVAEKGLLVLDCIANGKAGHAARNEGLNAIEIAVKDIHWLASYTFPKVSDILGEVKATVTQINAGSQHNVIPDKCEYVIDIRTTEKYSNKEIYVFLKEKLRSEVKARSFRINSSCISLDHPIVKRGFDLGLKTFGSPTTSDQSVLPFTSIKIGPGNSSRSHAPDEFIYLKELEEGAATYYKLLKDLKI
ncbi:M20 family metallo-hydrolase [Bacteroidota bacterium]